MGRQKRKKKEWMCYSCKKWSWRVFTLNKTKREHQEKIGDFLKKQNVDTDAVQLCTACWNACVVVSDGLVNIKEACESDLPHSREVSKSKKCYIADAGVETEDTDEEEDVGMHLNSNTPEKLSGKKRAPPTPTHQRETPSKIPMKRSGSIFMDSNTARRLEIGEDYHSEDFIGNTGRYFNDKYFTENLSDQPRSYLDDVDFELKSLCCTAADKSSVLRQLSLETMEEGEILKLLIKEMREKCGTLLDVLITAMCGVKKPVLKDIMGPLALVYGVVMFTRNQHLSGLQRLMTIIMTKARVPERVVRTLQRLGLHLTYQAKLNLMSECVGMSQKTLQLQLKSGRLMTLVGDNMDIRITPRILTSERKVKDCHFYATMMVASRLDTEIKNADKTVPTPYQPPPEKFVLDKEERARLLFSYKVLMARNVVNFCPAFKFMEGLYPLHIPFTYSKEMAGKSDVWSLPVIFKDEKHLEQCVNILDETTKNLGGYLEKVEEYTGAKTLPYHGDQLTRVRMQSAKQLRVMAPDARSRFEAIGPFVCTFWHLKLDFLDKLYSLAWDKSLCSSREPLTLRNFAVLFNARNVNGNVKSNYAAHEQLVLRVGELLQVEQLLTYLSMDNHESWPDALPTDIESRPKEEQRAIADEILDGVIKRFEYAQFAFTRANESEINPPLEERHFLSKEVGRTTSGLNLKIVTAGDVEEDELMANCNNIAQLALHLQLMNDYEKEGDFERAIISCKFLVPFLHRHSSRSKYFIECLDLILKGEVVGSESERLRVLESAFVNPSGGPGNGYPIDLMCEHGVCRKKSLIQGLGANKSEAAISRVTGASDTIEMVFAKVEGELGVPQKRGRHTDTQSEKDKIRGMELCRQTKPMEFTRGRKFEKHKPIPACIYKGVDIENLRVAIHRTSARLLKGYCPRDEEEEEVSTDEEGLPGFESE